jgi:hypothetical protein
MRARSRGEFKGAQYGTAPRALYPLANSIGANIVETFSGFGFDVLSNDRRQARRRWVRLAQIALQCTIKRISNASHADRSQRAAWSELDGFVVY